MNRYIVKNKSSKDKLKLFLKNNGITGETIEINPAYCKNLKAYEIGYKVPILPQALILKDRNGKVIGFKE